MYAEERQQQIAALIEEKGKVSIAELAEMYGISGESARRDLRALEQQGLCKRTHGGAIRHVDDHGRNIPRLRTGYVPQHLDFDKEMPVTVEDFMAADASGPERKMTEKDTLARVMKEMERLPEKQAKVLRMRALEGLEYDEIARRTGLSLVNIRVLISMARKTLKKRIGK